MNGLLSSIIESQRRTPVENRNNNTRTRTRTRRNNIVFNQRINNRQLYSNNMYQLLRERQNNHNRNNLLRRTINNNNIHSNINNLNYFFNMYNINHEINNIDERSHDETSRLDEEPLLRIPLETSTDLSNNTIEIIEDELFMETILRDNNNNITRLNFPLESEIDNMYHTIFEFERYRIQYNHQNIMSPDDADYVLQGILSNIYDQEMMQQLNPGEYINPGNDNDDINKIKSILTEKKYFEIKHIIKNTSCPICVEDFVDSDNICMFSNCNHGFNAEYKDKFIKLFNRCPLCNDKLI